MRFLQSALWTILFGLAYTQAPLYYSNQNQYFLHGLADAGVGDLSQDKLAQSVDPTPLFSLMVRGVAQVEPWLFHPIYVILMGIYLHALLRVFETIRSPSPPLPPGERGVNTQLRLVFLAIIFLIHSAIGRWVSYRLFGNDYLWYLQAGVAGQYILGGMFQPSTFGVLLMFSIVYFKPSRAFSSVYIACLAAYAHPTYILHAGLLTFAYWIVLVVERRRYEMFAVPIFALVLISPVAFHTYYNFGPSSGTELQEAQRILARVRIPHHCDPKLWCDGVALAQLVSVLVAIALTPITRLRIVLAVTAGVALFLTVIQVMTASDAVALLFPWRIFSVLVPISTAIIVTRLVLLFQNRLNRISTHYIGPVLIGSVTLAGLVMMLKGVGYANDPDELPMMNFVKANAQPGDVYAIPVRIPDLNKSTRGSLSGDFKPIAAKKQDARLIPGDLQRFRLYTGVPIYVDFKSVPYQSGEVIHWHSRLHDNQAIYKSLAPNTVPAIYDKDKSLKVTHIVTAANVVWEYPYAKLIYLDDFYRIYKLNAP